MSGHSKWSTIKRQKGVTDAKRGQAFTKAANSITVTARDGGGNPESNFKLRLAIEAAKNINMPKNNIEKAIVRGVGSGKGEASLEQIIYEGFGPGGTAILVESVTDNRSRTAQEVRSVFDKSAGQMGDPGSVSHLFKQIGEITIKLDQGTNQDDILLAVADAGADDFEVFDKEALVFCAPTETENVKNILTEKDFKIVDTKISRQPNSVIKIDDEKVADAALSIIEKLEDLQDVQTVYSNFDVSDEILNKESSQ